MSLRGRYVGVAWVVLIEFGAALLLGIGAAEAEPRKSPFRTAQIVSPSTPEPPLADQPLPPPPPASAPRPDDPPTPVVSIQVRAPADGAAGQEIEYRILVANHSRAPAHHVLVRNPLPAHAKFVRATPKPDEERGELLWQLGTLDGCANREIVLVLAPTGGGDVDNCARVQFEHGQCVTTRISGPQLAVRIDGPREAKLGQPIMFRITVTNTGTAGVSRVNLVTKFQEGWQIEGKAFEKGAASELSRSWDTLGPGQSETLTVEATPREEGRLCFSAEATAAGGLSSRPARHCVNVAR
jgi:uncharacterized repeat protein (TIGR01451 family)